MKKIISTIMYSNKAAKINEYEKFVKWSKTKNMIENAEQEEANATKEQNSKGLYLDFE